MRLAKDIPKESTFVYREEPVSGNKINGLGEKTKRRASYVFHSNPKTGPLPWDKLNQVFLYCYPIWGFPLFIANRFAAFAYQGKLAREKRHVDDALAMADEVRQVAKNAGAAIVGICELRDDYLIEGASFPYRYAVSIAIPMDREIMVGVPNSRAGLEVIRGYKRCAKAAVKVARFIRSLGWDALAFPMSPSSEVLQIPIAIAAGVGQLGKHGSLITKEFGSNVRLTTVLTSLPMVPSEVEDIAVDDLCVSCTVCSRACPPDAIFDEKQWVRGNEKWYVDFDKCIYYFAETQGCGICIEVCPWSEPGRGPWLAETLLERRKKLSPPTSG